MFDKLEAVEKRYEELTKMIADPEVISNQAEWQKAIKEHSSIEDIVMTAIALEDKVHFSFGTIGGKTKAPRVQKMPNGEIVHVPEKKGQPYYKPSKIAKDY